MLKSYLKRKFLIWGLIIFLLSIPIFFGIFFINKKYLNQKIQTDNFSGKFLIGNEESAFVWQEDNSEMDKPEKKIGEIVETFEKIPEKIMLDVPFTSQAPFSVWDAYHEDACEEAAIIMVKYYLDKKVLTPEIAEKEIQAMIKFELGKYGDYKSSKAQEIVNLAQDFYQIKNLKLVYDIKKEDIKKYLAKGKPIIVPAAGRLLGNPNFTSPGPLYHNLVLIGYQGDIIVTNDPGTRKGKGYTYSLDTLYSAIHDFPGKSEDIEKGKKVLIVLE